LNVKKKEQWSPVGWEEGLVHLQVPDYFHCFWVILDVILGIDIFLGFTIIFL